MLVSNVPDRCDTHAAEVANVALDVMDTVQHYEIDHRPDWTLQVRIGINTGTHMHALCQILLCMSKFSQFVLTLVVNN